MQKPQGYDETVVTTTYEPITIGGHYLIILGAKQETLNGYEVLTVQFDTHQTDHQPSYYQADYKRRIAQYPDSKYQGVHRLFLPTGDPNSDTYKWANQRLKGFITSVEDSNSGYKFTWDEKTLKGKSVGGVFGNEEYLAQDGTVKMATRLRYYVGNESVPTAKAPKVKELKTKPAPIPGYSEDDTALPFQL